MLADVIHSYQWLLGILLFRSASACVVERGTRGFEIALRAKLSRSTLQQLRGVTTINVAVMEIEG